MTLRIQYDISGGTCDRNLFLVFTITKWMSGNLKKIGLMVVTLTFDLEIQGQTWCNAFNMISLVVYIVETFVWCL